MDKSVPDVMHWFLFAVILMMAAMIVTTVLPQSAKIKILECQVQSLKTENSVLREFAVERYENDI